MLKELLFSYNESYVPKVDVEGMISVKEKKYCFSKRKQKEIVSINSISRIKKVPSEESCCGVGAVMCCFLDCDQNFLHQMTRMFEHEFWNKSFDERSAHTLDIPRSLRRRRDCNNAKFMTFQDRDVCETTWYKIMGILRSIYMSYKQESKRGCIILPHQNKGSQK